MPLEPGLTTSRQRYFDLVDFDRFARLSGNDNPIHIDPGFAARTRFRRPVAPGMLSYAAICQVQSELTGPGSRQVQQVLNFLAPTYRDEEIIIESKKERSRRIKEFRPIGRILIPIIPS